MADGTVRVHRADASDTGDGGASGGGVVLERFDWYTALLDFSEDIPPPKSAGYGDQEDPDQNLVPKVGDAVCCGDLFR